MFLDNIVTIMIVLPLIGALVQFGATGKRANGFAFIFSAASAICGLVAFYGLVAGGPGAQISDNVSWVGSYAINYHVATDGLIILSVLLVSIVFPVLIVSEWSREVGGRGVYGLLLVLQSSILGMACAQDLFLLLFFSVMTAFPVYFLTALWGGKEREAAATRYIVTASISSVVAFCALMLIYYSIEPGTFSIQELSGGKIAGKTFVFLGNEMSVSDTTFFLVIVAALLRLPLWPFNGWFSALLKQAPASAAVAVSGVYVPVAFAVLLRVLYSLFPGEMLVYAQPIMIYGAVNGVVGAFSLITQRNLWGFLAVYCVSQVGVLLLGVGSLASAGVVGALFQAAVFGLSVSALGLVLGVLTGRAGEVQFQTDSRAKIYGGIAVGAPMLALVAGILIATLLGVPGLGGFVGQALIYLGAFGTGPVAVGFVGVSALFLVFGLFHFYRQIFLGEAASGISAQVADLTIRERMYLFPVVAAVLFCGIYPRPFLETVRPAAVALLSMVK